jgi:hypothetical protein
MINNARAESDAASGRAADGKAVLPSTERAEDDGYKRASIPLSDRGASPYDDFDGIKRRDTERGSI